MSIQSINSAPPPTVSQQASATAQSVVPDSRASATTTSVSSAPVEQTARALQAGDAVRGRNDEVNRLNANAPTKQPDEASIQTALKDVQDAISGVASDLRFSVDKDSGKTLIKIVDRETDEVIKQIPSEELVRISKALDKLQGLLVKQEV